VSAVAFHIPAHATIHALLLEMWDANRPIDVLTLTQVCAIGISSTGWAARVCLGPFHLPADCGERGLLPRDRRGEAHPAGDHPGLHGIREPLLR
jgi:hypothetical protein